MSRSILLAFLLLALTGCASAVVSSGQPDETAIESWAGEGVTTVIDLRGENESRGFDEPAAVAHAGMTYLSLPISGKADVNFDNAARLGVLIEAADGPVVVHCASGNRVGALLALRASLDGASDEKALEIGRANRLSSLEDHVRQTLAKREID